MIKANQIRTGLLIWWDTTARDDDEDSWSCPGVVTKVENDEFWVQTFDDFEETGPIPMYPAKGCTWSNLEDMRVCTQKKAEKFLSGQLQKKLSEVSDAKKVVEEKEKAWDFVAQKCVALLLPDQK